MAEKNSYLGGLYASLKAGNISRRDFIQKASGAGLGAAGAIFLANSAVIAASGGSKNGWAVYQGADGTPAASPAASPADLSSLSAGTEGQTRGAGGELKMVQWQAATSAFIHTATGTKDFLAGSLVNEPLFVYTADGSIVPWLGAEVPSVENGMLKEDLSGCTLKLKEGLLWSDGKPLTAKDVVFTWQWITTKSNASVNLETWSNIKKIEAVDDLTAEVTYAVPSAAWFEPFVDYTVGVILPSHVFGDDPANRNMDFEQNPIGSGPFKVTEFKANDQVTYEINENYREPNKPFFNKVVIKGGGDAPAAARAVATGDYHFAWNLQVEPDVLNKIMEEGGEGKVTVALGTSLERIHINFSDPNKEVDGQKSEVNTPHPIFSDKAVRDAMNLAVDRETIATKFYGPGQPATANFLNGIESFTSLNTSWKYDLDAANKVLDDAGWALDGEVRKKDGVELKINYATSVNAVRQKTQALVKESFSKIGIKVQLLQVDAGIYFDGSAGNDQNINHFYWDMDMYTNNPTSTVPLSYMVVFYAGKDNENVAQKANDWQGQNFSRWINKDFDAAFEELQVTTDFDKASELLIKMNDIMINDVAIIPEVNRSADTYAASNKLRASNIALGPLNSSDYWNIANWNWEDGITSW